MAKRKRHTVAQIAAKLEQGRGLSREGLSQSEVAKILGVSVMTYHRWRKQQPLPPVTLAHSSEENSALIESGNGEPDRHQSRISELLIENGQLRKIVTDLLLEKLRLQEEIEHRQFRHGLRSVAV